MLTLVAWSLTLILGLLGNFRFNTTLLLGSFLKFLICGGLLFLLSSPIVLLTLLMKSYVPPIILTVIITMTNLMLVNSKHKDLFPWTATLDIANNELQPHIHQSILISSLQQQQFSDLLQHYSILRE